ncbi:peptidyl-prolyl cis-trans isomerase [Bacteroidia bacterium]|nr:peptidyl-prolyl cis-trans isomerase [Bacteroidia bacterium]
MLSAPTSCTAKKGYKFVVMETTAGNIKLKLYEDTPLHSENFLKLVENKHYDGMLFHRVIKDFMIQGGSGDSRGAEKGKMLGAGGGVDYTIPAEFRTTHFHIKGALAAARLGDQANPQKASSGEQFYIVQGRPYSEQELNVLDQRRNVKLPIEVRELYKSVGGTPFLDENYTVFGEVVEGMDVVEKIANQATAQYDRPIEDVVIIKAYLKKK